MDNLPRALAGVLGKVRPNEPVPREKLIRDLLQWIVETNLSDAEAEALHKVATQKVRSGTCTKCLKLKPKYEGEVRDGKFICGQCRFML